MITNDYWVVIPLPTNPYWYDLCPLGLPTLLPLLRAGLGPLHDDL